MTATVRTESAAVSEMSQAWPMIRALIGGTLAMRAAGKTYLPQWPNEQQESYDARLKVATLYPAFARTIEVLAGKPFSKPLTLGEDVPPRIAEWSEDIDLQGRNLHTFAFDVMNDVIAYGLSGVLVDYPRANGVRTLADERAVGARPYFTRYAPGTVLGWRTEQRNGATRLTQLRLLETVSTDDGPWATKDVEQVRVLTPGAWEVWRTTDKGEWTLFEDGVTTLTEIPFVFFYGIRKGFGIGVPPLLELAHQNVEHWQSASDQQTVLHVARVPILFAKMLGEETEITVGANSAVIGETPDSDLKFVEHSGAAIEAGRESLKDLQERMRETGAELLVLRPGQITATQVASENEANKCTLQRIAEGLEDGLDQCLQFAASWAGEAEGGHVQLFKDFGAGTLSEASAKLVLEMQQGGLISKETAIREQQRRGVLSADLDPVEEMDRAEMDGPALGAMNGLDGQ